MVTGSRESESGEREITEREGAKRDAAEKFASLLRELQDMRVDAYIRKYNTI